MGFLVAALVAMAVVFRATEAAGDFPATMQLERAFPLSHRVEASELVSRDKLRHARILQSSDGVVDFLVEGTFNPFLVG